MKVDLDERRLEGDYWVVRLTEAMKHAEDEYFHAGEVIRKGWLVVKGQWLQYTEPCYDGSTKVGRSYKLLLGDRILNVNSLVRIEKLKVTARRSGTFMLPNDEDERVLSTIH